MKKFDRFDKVSHYQWGEGVVNQAFHFSARVYFSSLGTYRWVLISDLRSPDRSSLEISVRAYISKELAW